MIINFSKYHGAGNDFILIDNRQNKICLSENQVELLCHRRYGIGADGLMILESDADYDFRMKYYNSDGKESTMCGNGGRCIVAFAYHLGVVMENCIFIAPDGQHKAVINKSQDGLLDVSLEMVDVKKINKKHDSYFIDTGSPHHITFVENVDKVDVFNEGAEIRYSQKYKDIGGVNVNFVEICEGFLKIRTFERGVEDETYACGTGATAAAIAYADSIKKYNEIFKLKAVGGELRVSFDFNNDVFTNVVLSGPAKYVFDGKWEFADEN